MKTFKKSPVQMAIIFVFCLLSNSAVYAWQDDFESYVAGGTAYPGADSASMLSQELPNRYWIAFRDELAGPDSTLNQVTCISFTDNNTVEFEYDHNGIVDKRVILKRGESLTDTSFSEGTLISSKYPLQVAYDYIFSDYGAYEDGALSYDVFPEQMLGTNYWIPLEVNRLSVLSASADNDIFIDLNGDGKPDQTRKLQFGQNFRIAAPAGTHIWSSKPIYVVGANHSDNQYDQTFAFSALPEQALSTEYYFPREHPHAYQSPTELGGVYVIAPEDNTSVTIGTTTKLLSRGQTYFFKSVTEGLVMANKPIFAVYLSSVQGTDPWAGVRRIYDYAFPLMPASVNSKSFVIGASGNRDDNGFPTYQLAVVSLSETNTIRIDCGGDGKVDFTKALKKGEFFYLNEQSAAVPCWESSSIFIDADQPVQVSLSFRGWWAGISEITSAHSYFGNITGVIAKTNQPPLVAIPTPQDAAVFPIGTNIVITAEASDADGTVSSVEFYDNGSSINIVTNAPFTMVWSNVFPGNHTITAKAVDNGGLFALSAPVSIIVGTPPNIPPAVVITNPTNGAVFIAAGNVLIRADANDSDGFVTKVVFFEGTNRIGVATNTPFSMIWSNVSSGNYVLTAKAVDDAGFVSESAPVNISVSECDLTQGLVAYYPLNGTALDASGNGINGTVHGAVPATDRFGVTNGCFYFNGNGQYISAAADKLPTTQRTISLWFKANQVDNLPAFLGYGGSSCGDSFFLGLNHWGNGAYVVSTHCDAYTLSTPYSKPPINEWHHWALVLDDNGLRSYLDCQLIGSRTGTTQTYVAGTQLGLGVISSPYGQVPYTDGNVGYLDGYLDDVRIYNRALSEQELACLCGDMPHNPPTVSITDPTDGKKYVNPANVSITATADGNGGDLASVQLFQGGTNLLGVSTASPYTLVWSSVVTGDYVLTAVASNSFGLSATSAPVNVSVEDLGTRQWLVKTYTDGSAVRDLANADALILSTLPIATELIPEGDFVGFNSGEGTGHFALDLPVPGIDQTQPTDNYAVQGTGLLIIPATGTYTFGLNTDDGARLRIDNDTVIVDDVLAPPHDSEYVSLFLSAGSHPIEWTWFNGAGGFNGGGAVAEIFATTDGQTSFDSSFQLVGQLPGLLVIQPSPPSVAILSPPSGASFIGPTNISITATASDTDGSVTKVEFFEGLNPVGTLTNAPFSLVWSNAPAGNYALTAIATDNDGLMTTSAPVNITIVQVNRPPSISPVADQTTLEDTPAQVAFTVGDAETPAENIVGSVVSSDPGLVAPTGIALAGAATNRTVTLTPVKDQFGVTTITITVKDGAGLTATRNFDLTVLSVNDHPTMDTIPDQVVAEDALEKQISLTGIGTGAANEVQKLTISATSDSPALVPNPSVTYVTPGTTGVLKFQPLPNANGVAHITVTIKDDGGIANGGIDTFSRQFTVTVTPVNDSPTVNITSPTNGSVFLAGTNVLIHADAHDIDGTIAKVEFFQGNSKLGEKTAAPYEFNWISVSAGSYVLTARAFDNDGLSSTSAPVTIKVVPVPGISVNDLSVREGDTGQTNVLVLVSLSSSSPDTVTVGYQTVDGSALAGQDYQAVSGSLIFAPGETNKAISVSILGDLVYEPDESFTVVLSGVSGGVIGKDRGTITILNDDPLPQLSINNVSVVEGNSGTTDAVFAVSLAGQSSLPVTVDYTTRDGTALAGSDYLSRGGTLTFAPSEGGSGAVVAVADVERPVLQVSHSGNAIVMEWTSSGTSFDLLESDSISLSNQSWRKASAQVQFDGIRYSASVVATDSSKFYRLASSAIPLVQEIHVPIVGDLVAEDTENFFVNLSNPNGATILNGEGEATIIDNDSPASPPGVGLISPENGDVFPVGSVIIVTAIVTPGSNPVDRVDFFANGTKIGSASIAPYTISWSDGALGSYALKAVAFDHAGGSGESTLVNIDVVPNDGQKRIAIVQNFADAEISKMQAWLTDMDLSSKVFNQEGLTFELLKSFDLVIWDDLGTVAGGLSANDVNVFESLYGANIPLYFIGSKLVGSESNLPADTQLVWHHLIRLNSTNDPIGGNQVTVNDDRHPVNNGPFGLVGSFKLQNDIEPDVARGTGEQVVAGTDHADAVLVEEDSEERTVTQNLLALEGGGVNATVQREKLFKNAVWWLLKLPPPPPFLNLSVDVISEPESPKVGSELTLTATVQHSGESEATGITMTMVLPSNLAFVSATSDAGTCVFEDGVVICSLGSLTHTDTAAVVIVTKPNAPGSTDIITSVSPNQPEAETEDNSITTTVEVVK